MINAETERRGDAEKIENFLSEQILDAAIEVHRTLGGPGLLTRLKLGIVANFGQSRLIDGWDRVVNDL